jgi:predicted metal-binding membrane protein
MSTTAAGSPKSTLSLLGRPATIAVVATLLGLAALAWLLTVRQATGMAGMVTGLGQVGAGMPNDMGAPLFMAMWLTMMVAMMFPTIAPMVLAHRSVVRRRGEGSLPTVAFVAGYLVIWTAIGLLPLAGFLGFRNLSAGVTESVPLRVAAGGVLVVAGLYQFTPWKRICLNHCRSPLAFVMTHDFGAGSPGAARAGMAHGAFCLGCCWALMAVLVVVGLMNLVWMALIAAVFFLEKNWRHGRALLRVVGPALVVLGVAVIVQPALLTWIAGGRM